MSELQPSQERKLSSEQEALIEAARSLLESRTGRDKPELYYSYRPTTKAEKARRFIGSVLSKDSKPETKMGTLFETPEKEITIKTVGLRSLGGWGDVLYLKQTITSNLDTNEVSESLSMYATHIKSDRLAATDAGAWYEEITWQQDLLTLITDAGEIKRLQSELNDAAQRIASEKS